MSATVVQKALRRSLAQIQHVAAIAPGAARGRVAAVYAQVEQDFGMLAPPVVLHSPAPGPLAACWVMLRETLVARGLADRAAKETVAAAVSLANTCPYCVTVHNAVLGGLTRGHAATVSSSDGIGSIADPALRDLASWARSSGQRAATMDAVFPFPAEQLPELAGVAVTFQYLNRMVTVFLKETPLPAAVPGPVAGGLMRVLGAILGSAARSGPEPGASLALLPEAALAEAALPEDLRWAAARPSIADAFARANAAIETAGVHAAPEAVRELVRDELASWDGRPRGPSRSWVDDAVARLPTADRPAGRLALLTAFAPYQIGPADIEEFRRRHVGDEKLVELTSWASLAAARRVGSWLGGEGRRCESAGSGVPPSAPAGPAP